MALQRGGDTAPRRPGDAEAMELALELARRGPAADANPRVGCVVTDAAGRVLGHGHHRGAGSPHAEVAALADAARHGRDVSGATAHVTLEPCAHTGRTGPCADALVAAGIARVVHSATDPGVASGGGADRLRAAGIEVEHRPDPRADALVRHWRFASEHGRPFVTWKFAATLDGRLAAADGTSRWITSEQARADVHRLRAEAGAIVTGTGTVLADDPRLTVRGADDRPAGRQPLRVVAGDRPLPPQTRVLDPVERAPATLVVPGHDPAALLAQLHARDIRHAFLECGPTLGAAFLRAGLVDEIVAYLAPALLGAGPPAVGDLGIGTIADAARFDLRTLDRIGSDVRLVLTPKEA